MGLIKKENICVAETYMKGNEEKKKFNRIGEILTFESNNGSTFQKMKLFTMPNVDISIFDDKKDDKKDSNDLAF